MVRLAIAFSPALGASVQMQAVLITRSVRPPTTGARIPVPPDIKGNHGEGEEKTDNDMHQISKSPARPSEKPKIAPSGGNLESVRGTFGAMSWNIR